MLNPTTSTHWKRVLSSAADADKAAPLPPAHGCGDDVVPALDDGDKAERKVELDGAAPRVSRWLGDMREDLPTAAVAVMQQDAVTRLRLNQLLLEPEILRTVQANVHLVGTLLQLNGARLSHDRLAKLANDSCL